MSNHSISHSHSHSNNQESLSLLLLLSVVERTRDEIQRDLAENIDAWANISRAQVLARSLFSCSTKNTTHAIDGGGDDVYGVCANGGRRISIQTHYREIPPVVSQSYALLEQGAHIVQAASTKLTLLFTTMMTMTTQPLNHPTHTRTQTAVANTTTITAQDVQTVTADVARGCAYIGTACAVLEWQLGPSARHYVLTASRNILRAVVQLLEVSIIPFLHDEYDAATTLFDPTTTTTPRENDFIKPQEEEEEENEEKEPENDKEENEATLSLSQQQQHSAKRMQVCTGVVWEATDVIVQKQQQQIPRGNRNAMRRDLFVFMKECQETLDEFQRIIDQGPSFEEEEESDDATPPPPLLTTTTTTNATTTTTITTATTATSTTNEEDDDENEEDKAEDEAAENNDTDWKAFLDGHSDQYSACELPVAVACLALIKCSRGTLQLALLAMDAVGCGCDGAMMTTPTTTTTSKTTIITIAQEQEQEQEQDHNNHENDEYNKNDERRISMDPIQSPQPPMQPMQMLRWTGELLELARHVGIGMTDLGATLYPPLELDTVKEQVLQQVAHMNRVLTAMIVNTSSSSSSSSSDDGGHDGDGLRFDDDELLSDTDAATSPNTLMMMIQDDAWRFHFPFPSPVTELHRTLSAAVAMRLAEALEVLSHARTHACTHARTR